MSEQKDPLDALLDEVGLIKAAEEKSSGTFTSPEGVTHDLTFGELTTAEGGKIQTVRIGPRVERK